MTQPKALYLADILEDAGKPADVTEAAAAELRRLHDENENTLKHFAQAVEAYKTMAVERDALLEALKAIVAMWDHHCDAHGDGTPSPLHVKARAAIAKAEENK